MTQSRIQREQSQCVCRMGRRRSAVDMFKAQVRMLALFASHVTKKLFRSYFL